MKVYVLEKCYDYEGCSVISIHATNESAKAAAQKLIAAKDYPDDVLEITEFEVNQ